MPHLAMMVRGHWFDDGFVAISGVDAGTIGPAVFQHIVNIWPAAVQVDADNVKKLKSLKCWLIRSDFFILLPKDKSKDANLKSPGAPYDNVGVRLLDLLEAKGYHCISTESDNQTFRTVFRKV